MNSHNAPRIPRSQRPNIKQLSL